MRKEITLFILALLCLTSFLSILPLNVNAGLTYLANNSATIQAGYGAYFDSTYTNVSLSFIALNTAYLDTATISLTIYDSNIAEGVGHHPVGTFRAYLYGVDGTNNYPNMSKLIETSSSIFTDFNNGGIYPNDGRYGLTFAFSKTNQLINGTKYCLVVNCVYSDFVVNKDYFYLSASNGVTGYTTYGTSNNGVNWSILASGYSPTNFWVFGQDTTTPSPTPIAPAGTVKVNYFINPSRQYGNFTVCIPPTTNYVDVDSTSAWFFNDGTTLLFLPKLATGWYFWNYTLLTDTGYNLTYPINNWAIMLNSSLGSVWNITLGISQTANTVDLKLIDVQHGSIYFQNYVNSVPTGVRYGAGTYNITYSTVLYIATLPDSGYKTDYYTVVSNGLTQKVEGQYLTFIASSNATITPHYALDSSTGVTGGTNSFFAFFTSFTWQNIAVLIIYIVIVGICTYLFAFTGLIAGLDIATTICFITGLLGNLMYPVLGLVIVCNIALIIVGSGLLNRKKNGVDA